MANPIVPPNNKYSGKTLDLNGNIIDKSGWDVYEYIFNDTPYSGSTITFGVDIFIYDTWGKNWWKEGSEPWDKMLFELKAEDSSSYDNFFTNFDNASPTESENADFYYGTYKDMGFQVKSNFEYVESVDEPKHLERVNNMLVTNQIDVSQGMTIEFQGVKSSVYVPTVVAFDVNGNIVVSASTWKDGAFTYKVPENIKKIVIQIYNNGTKTNIRSKMPPVLLAASYKDGQLMDYVIKANYNIERDASETSERDLSRETFNTYYINYILKNKFDKILVTAQHYGSANKVNIEKNTIRKPSVIGYESKEKNTFPNAVSTVESYIYATLLNRIKSLENKIK